MEAGRDAAQKKRAGEEVRGGEVDTNTQTNVPLWPLMGPRHRALTEPRTGRPIEAAPLGCARVAPAGLGKKKEEGGGKEAHPAGTRAD